MNNKKGFTLVEILAVVAILAILATAAGLGISSTINKQRQKLAYTAEENIAESSLSYFTNKGNNYIKACTDEEGAYVTLSQKDVEAANKFLREKFASQPEENFYQLFKDYSNTVNKTPLEMYELKNNNIIRVKDLSCLKTVTVGELIEQGFITDNDGMCNKASLIFAYRRADAKNTAGTLDTVQEAGICKSDKKEERGPVITITPYSDLAFSSHKIIKIDVTTETTKLIPNIKMYYGWSNTDVTKPTMNKEVTLAGDEKKASATIEIDRLDEIKYLWIKKGSTLDDKNNKTSEMVAGPYAFLATPLITYDVNNGRDECPDNKKVVFTRPYGKDIYGIDADLCKPTRKGYTFKFWTYKDTTEEIGNESIVNDKNDHTLKANWEPNKYNITLNKNGGTTNPSPSTIEVTFDDYKLNPSSITLPQRKYTVSGFGLDATRKSNGATVSSTNSLTSTYTFNGWYTKSSEGSKLLTESATPSLLPNVDKYTDEGSNWVEDNHMTAYAYWTGNSVTLPTIAKTGYTCGWTTSSTGTTIEKNGGISYTPTANTTMYGVCKACDYYVVFNKNSNSATGTMEKKTCTYDSNCTLTSNGYSLSGYTFNGWYDASSNKYTNGKIVKNLTSTCRGEYNLYAYWCQNCASVSNGSCSLDVSTPGTCTYTTTCNTNYELTSGAGTRSPTCTIKKHNVRIDFKYDQNLKDINSSNHSDTHKSCKDINIGSACVKDLPSITGYGDKSSTCNHSSYNDLFDFVWKNAAGTIVSGSVSVTEDATFTAYMIPKDKYVDKTNKLKVNAWQCEHPGSSCPPAEGCNSVYRTYKKSDNTMELNGTRAINENHFIKWDGTWKTVDGELYFHAIGADNSACHNNVPETTACAWNYQPARNYKWS